MIAELTSVPGVTITDLMNGTRFILMVNPVSIVSIVLPSLVFVIILNVSVVSRVSGFKNPGMLTVYEGIVDAGRL